MRRTGTETQIDSVTVVRQKGPGCRDFYPVITYWVIGPVSRDGRGPDTHLSIKVTRLRER